MQTAADLRRGLIANSKGDGIGTTFQIEIDAARSVTDAAKVYVLHRHGRITERSEPCPLVEPHRVRISRRTFSLIDGGGRCPGVFAPQQVLDVRRTGVP